MEKSVEVYGNINIYDCIAEKVTKEFPINLEYYKIHNNEERDEEKPYGIGIIKTYKNKMQTIMEKCEFNNIFSHEKEADNVLKVLIENEVTPVSLRDILEDLNLVLA